MNFCLLAGDNEARPLGFAMAPGRAELFSVASPEREDTPNEDAAMAFDLGGGRAVLAVADGVGGQRGGADASALALETLRESLSSAPSDAPLRTAILNAFEQANRAVLELAVGAATTLAVVEIDDTKLRAYHVGDSEIWVVGQRGRLKLQTISHSPVGYARESGILSESEALAHESRHWVSNVVGSEDMRIEMGSALELAPRDTVVLGSDGLFDNMDGDAIVETVRKGSLERARDALAATSQQNMATGKPDDLTFVLFRASSGGGA